MLKRWLQRRELGCDDMRGEDRALRVLGGRLGRVLRVSKREEDCLL